MTRTNISSPSPWEPKLGYSRAVKVGPFVHIGGTIASDEHGNIAGIDDAEAQARFIWERIGKALAEAGASFSDVVRTRTFITNIDLWEAAMKPHGEIFRDIRPAATLVEVSRLIVPDGLLEIEVDAIVVAELK